MMNKKNLPHIVTVVSFVVLVVLGLACATSPGSNYAAASTVKEGWFEGKKEGNGIIIIKYTGSQQELIIPSSIQDLPVIGIGKEAFAKCASLVNVTIPASVTSIGQNAFIDCTKLTSITIPDGVISIGSQAFFRCISLTSITIPDSVTSIGAGAFSGCTSLPAITVASGNTAFTIQDGVLYNKDKSLLIQYPGGKTGAFTIPNSVTSIGELAFLNCPSLVSVTMPNSVTSIGEGAFGNCTNLARVTIGNGVTSIGELAFLNCTRLASITIPSSVTSIKQQAFRGCDSLTSVTFQGTIPSSGFAEGTGPYLADIYTGRVEGTPHPFHGDLRDKFYATDRRSGTPGTYSTTPDIAMMIYAAVWKKQ